MAGYVIGSDKGKQIANNLSVGGTYKASDGSTWKKNSDGTVSVTTKNGGYTANALSTSTPRVSTSTPKASTSSSTKRTNTTVYDPSGNAVSGYIEAGKTYLSDGSRIGDGYSSVDSSGRIWKMQNGQGVLSGSIKDGLGGGQAIGAVNNTTLVTPDASTINTAASTDTAYDSYIKAMQNEEAKAAEERAAQRKAQLEASKESLNKQYDDAARQAYITAEQTKRNTPEIMAARGMSGGATESQLLAADTTYQNNLADLNSERANALAQVDLSAQDVDADLSETLADINTNYNTKLLNYYLDEQEKEQELFQDTIGQYSDDYQKQINTLLAQGVPETDYRIMYLRAARQQKIQEQQQAEAEAAAAAAEAAASASRKSSSGSSRSSSGSSSSSGSGTTSSNASRAAGAASGYGYGTSTTGTGNGTTSTSTAKYIPSDRELALMKQHGLI